jgi:hypothetical protein|nr:TniB family NTP-binding protein [uncultured Pseudomonas sp.]
MNQVMNPLVCHHRFNVVQAEIEAVLARTEDGDPQILPIVGPTRVGKSKLLASIIASHVQAEPGGRRKIIDVVSPKHLTGRALPDACLVSIGMSTALFRNHVLATDAFIKAVNKHSTRMLVFDETQHMLERGGRTTVRAAADFIKLVFDQTRASIVLAGLPTLLGLFNENEQLADRALSPIQYYPYQWQGTDYKHFRSALGSALEHLAENGWDTFAFNDAEFARRMYVASAGRYGLIHKLFAEVQLVRQAEKVADYDAFTLAYQRGVIARLIDFNPFDIKHSVLVEHMALVYAKVMQEAGVSV